MKSKDDLRRDFPLLFREWPVELGIDIGDGWYVLVRNLCGRLEDMIGELPGDAPRHRVVQIKEKFGGLRFYMEHATTEMQSFIDEVQERSLHVCEVCGADGELRQMGTWKTLCDEHHEMALRMDVQDLFPDT